MGRASSWSREREGRGVGARRRAARRRWGLAIFILYLERGGGGDTTEPAMEASSMLKHLRRDRTSAAPGQQCAPASRDADELDPLALARWIPTRSAARLARSGEPRRGSRPAPPPGSRAPANLGLPLHPAHLPSSAISGAAGRARREQERRGLVGAGERDAEERVRGRWRGTADGPGTNALSGEGCRRGR